MSRDDIAVKQLQFPLIKKQKYLGRLEQFPYIDPDLRDDDVEVDTDSAESKYDPFDLYNSIREARIIVWQLAYHLLCSRGIDTSNYGEDEMIVRGLWLLASMGACL